MNSNKIKLAVDMRMSGKSGIGSYFDSLFPYFEKNFDVIQINPENIEPFSLKELFSFPKEELKKINSCDAYYTPYCNIPSGIKIPIFSTIHDIVFLDFPLTGKIGTMARKWFYKRACKKSSTIFTVSNFSADRIMYHLHCKKKIVVTYNASPAQYDEPKIKEEKSSPVNLLFVGNIKKHKGLHVLLEAFKIVLSTIPDAKLTIVGNAKNFRTGDETISKEINNFGDKVLFTGFISNEELNLAYHNASLLVQPSFYEGFGMPPLEALNCGTNVVLSDIPVFKEIYKDFPVTFFECGNASDLANKIFEALKKPTPENIPNIYSFERTFGIIKNTIEEI